MAWTTPGTAVAGEVLTAAFWNTQVRDNLTELAPLFSASTNYSSSLTFINVTVGNGTKTARYIKVGRLVMFWGSFLFGSTSDVTDTLAVNLPFTMENNSIQSGIIGARDNSTGLTYTGTAWVQTSQPGYFIVRSAAGSGADWNATNPFNWDNLDLFHWQLIYMASS